MPKFLSDVVIEAPLLQLTSDASNITPIFRIRDTTNAAASAPIIELNKNSATEDGEQLGNIQWKSLNFIGQDRVYASVESEIISNANNAELGKLTCFISSSNNTNPAGLILAGHAGTDSRVDATVGNTTDSVTTIAGNLTISGGITNSGTIAAGTWNGTVVASAYLDDDTAHLSVAQTSTAHKSFSAGVRYSYSSNAASASQQAGTYGVGADILFGTGGETVVAGSIYTLRGGVWTLIDADFENRCRDLVGMAVGTNSSTDGMLIKGCVTLKDVFVAGTDLAGMPVYASVTGGRATLVAPTGSGDIVRILGYSLDSADKAMYFNPDSTYVKIA
jgi:hypothetical protein